MHATERLQEELKAKGVDALAVGLFHPTNPQVLADVVALMAGAASVTAFSKAAGQAVDATVSPFKPSDSYRHDLPHRVVVVVTEQEVHLFASNREGDLGPEMATYEKGEFRARVWHWMGECDLTLDSKDQGEVVLKAKGGVGHEAARRAADAAAALAASNPPTTMPRSETPSTQGRGKGSELRADAALRPRSERFGGSPSG